MNHLLQDARFSLRVLRRRPGFAALAVTLMALGIGANAIIFSVVHAVLINPLPYRDPDALVRVYERRPASGRVRNVVSPADYFDWERQNSVFSDLAAVAGDSKTFHGDGQPDRVRGAQITSNFWRTMGVTPVLGRDFRTGEGEPGHDKVVILSHGAWLQRFGGDRSVIGRKTVLSGESYEIVGVLPPISQVMVQAEIWTPAAYRSTDPRSSHYLDVYGRLKPGVSVQRAHDEMNAIALRLAKEYPDANQGHEVNLFSLTDEVSAPARKPLLVLFAAVGFVLLIACANVANLFLVRVFGRRREIAVRTALGARRGTIVRQLLVESSLLGFMGGALGLVIAVWGIDAVVSTQSVRIPRLDEAGLHPPVLWFTVLISMATALLFGAGPAYFAASSDPGAALQETGRASAGHSRSRLRSILLASEVALALLLSVGAGLLFKSFLNLLHTNPGFDPSSTLICDVTLPSIKYTKDEQAVAFFDQVLEQVRRIPGVASAAAAYVTPLRGFDPGMSFNIEGQPPVPRANAPNARFRIISAGYFETMRIPIRSGREFSQFDNAQSPRSIVVNETLARQFWPGRNPIGAKLKFFEGKAPYEIVGVSADVKHQGLAEPVKGEVFFNYRQYTDQSMTLILRTAIKPEQVAAAVRQAVWSIDSALPVSSVQTMDDVLSDAVAQPRFYTGLMGVFAGLAVLLAAVGVYGVVAFSAGQRTQEIGIRVALGASPRDVIRLIFRQGAPVLACGVVAGLTAALVLTRLLGTLLFGVTPADLPTFILTTVAVLIVAAFAMYIPAKRAAGISPVIALKTE